MSSDQCRLLLHLLRHPLQLLAGGLHHRGLPRPRLRLCVRRGQRGRTEVVPAREEGADSQHCRQVTAERRLRARSGLSLTMIIDYSGYGFGSIIWIPTETAFINPANILPVTLNGSHCGEEGEEEGDCDKYFVDPSVLQRLEINIL